MATPSEVAQIIAENRLRKAKALAQALQDAFIDSTLAMEMDDHAWHIAAAKAGTKLPSDGTKDLVIQLLAQQEKN
jgi:hypothetical protein